MNARFPRWLWFAVVPAVGAGVTLGLWLFGNEAAPGTDGTLAAMQDVAFVTLTLAGSVLVVLVAALVAFACGWRPAGWGGPEADDDGGGGGGGGGSGRGPKRPPGPPAPTAWDEFDRLRLEWEAESRRTVRIPG